ncbi:MAG: FprA family A-type flavoprotein [Planctomycetes bacterium]|nr:FprA family A-type flavoprotein [Planctomycetota bacterium]MBU1518077.1 FprA family A-type flavoprotein [Planctomycetota bacterium]MBU2458516.1 FprA family A-type flavoprotein [Planctomycetota bacterium]MBU2597527.1 FprA family A-type flavoprotein [Planctomycetota bacterium]
MRQIGQNIFEVGAIDWDRRLFDELIPLPDGTSYNSYIVKGTVKTALIDTADPAKTDILITNLVGAGIQKIDFVIANHAEQDHSGSIPAMLRIYPEAKVVTNEKCKNMLIGLMGIDENKFIVIEDGQEISLGDKTLRFIFTPWVHWPETMSTYLMEDKILFSCDFFGSHLATSEVFVKDKPQVYESAKRYYAEIMMPFRGQIEKNLEKIKNLDIKIIAPSHGPLHDEPKFIIDAYKKWISDDVENKVIVAYVSMHGSTKKMVEHLVNTLIEKGIGVEQFNLIGGDVGKLAIELVDAAGVVLASPTVLTGAHPAAAYAAFLVNALRPKIKYLAVIGSFGWGGRMVEQLKGILTNSKAEILEPILVKGEPKDEDFQKLDNLAEEIAKRHKNNKAYVNRKGISHGKET